MAASMGKGVWTFEPGRLPEIDPHLVSAFAAPAILTNAIVAGLATLGVGVLMGFQGLVARALEVPPQPVAATPKTIALVEPAVLQPVEPPSPAGDAYDFEAPAIVLAPPAADILEPAPFKPAGLMEPRGGLADDLKKIKGIGPKLEMVLNDLGIWHYDQIAGWTPPECAWIEARLRFPGRLARDAWIEQARALAAKA